MKRRNFLKVVGGAAGGAVVMNSILGQAEPVVGTGANGMPLRAFGRTGMKVSIVGYSGFALREQSQENCNASIRDAFKRGLNYVDVAPAYGSNGECEIKMGNALEGIDRKSYYLACKTKARDKEGCKAELERSLSRLKTSYFDVYQLHHLVREEEVQKALGPGGAMETILKAREEGKIRAIGFSAHTTKAAVAALRGFKFDSVMFPINYVEYFTRDFGKEVIKVAQETGAAVLAIKAMNAGAPKPGETLNHKWWYRTLEEQEQINMAWRFSLSLPGVVTGFSPAFLDLSAKSVTAGHAFKPITEEETQKLQQMAQGQGSIFKREEDAAARTAYYECPYPHRPHECDGEYA